MRITRHHIFTRISTSYEHDQKISNKMYSELMLLNIKLEMARHQVILKYILINSLGIKMGKGKNT